jgi:hypothetical protein
MNALEAISSFTDAAIELTFQPAFLVGALLFYLLVSKKLVAVIRDAISLSPESSLLKAFVFVHNLALAVFSLGVFLNVAPDFYTFVTTNGWRSLHCDPVFWSASFGYWAKVFYVSKYWEFIDSWILILKGKECSFLQVYHHTGIVIAMYFGCVYECNWQIWLVLFNSFIHTLMYTYFAAATLGVRSKYAQVLTTMQLAQFVTGITLSSCIYFYEDCASPSQKYALVFIHVYAAYLITLFKEMYDKKYKDKKSGGGKKRA